MRKFAGLCVSWMCRYYVNTGRSPISEEYLPIGFFTEKRPVRGQAAIGLMTDHCAGLCRLVEAICVVNTGDEALHALSLESAWSLMVAYFRHDVTEKFLAPFFGVNQATVSRTLADSEVILMVFSTAANPNSGPR